MSDTILKCTTRHVRIFTAIVENDDFVIVWLLVFDYAYIARISP